MWHKTESGKLLIISMGVVAMTPPSFSLAAFRRLEVDFRAIAVSANSATVTTILQFQVFFL
jgi:hypothetical protein